MTDIVQITPTSPTQIIVGQGQGGAVGPAGPQGPQGRSITKIERTSGTGAAGTTDTYTITYSDLTSSTFQVANGADGNAATVTVGSTTTGSPGTSALVTPGGTPNARVLNFTIPRGDTGATGPTGVVVSPTAPSISQIWADPNDVTYTTVIDGGSA